MINLFVGEPLGAAVRGVKDESVQGFNIRHWREAGLNLWAVSDIDAGELDEFGEKFTAALHAPGPSYRPFSPRMNNKTGLYREFPTPRHSLPRS